MNKKEISELKKDKARIDWLADPNNEIGQVLLPTSIVEKNLDSFRAAVDEAMEMDKALKIDGKS